ncbi:hypothetical protein [uncultured Tessaracoccus sp.]|uniref:hypothetical protein n=1 Tax=uncultured Tessaracoccus sp. TaxID=905023 RepID=UPI00260D2343|nr:hypothetical protein [uncultured Tessaracoccus sp.]
MPRSAGDAAPRTYLCAGDWPDGHLRDDAPVSAHYGQEFAKRLRDALVESGTPSLRSVEEDTKVSRRTIERTLRGETLPDFGAIARLEEWLDRELWPGPDMRAGKTQRATREEILDQR